MTNETFTHPEGKIQLLDGSLIEGFPVKNAGEAVDNRLQLDTTGVYLSVGRRHTQPMPTPSEQQKEEVDLFVKNAFLFLSHRDRILSDSRMFLCPVNISNHLAYSGTSGFRHATLGVYIEWWMNCLSSITTIGRGHGNLVYLIAGSPLSGRNGCSVVNRQGETHTVCKTPFLPVWHSFMDINQRYDSVKKKYEAYSLQQVLDIFQKEGRTTVNETEMDFFFLEKKIAQLKQECREIKENSKREHDKIFRMLLSTKHDELVRFYEEYQQKSKQVEQRCEEIHNQRLEMRQQIRDGVMTPRKFQRIWTPLNKERDQLQFGLEREVRETLSRLFPELSLSLKEVEGYLKRCEQCEDKESHKQINN